MNSDDLTREQFQILAETTHRQLGYLNKLLDRMTRNEFPQTDPLWTRATKARDAMHDLWVHLHYASCGVKGDGMAGTDSPGTGEPREPIKTTHPRHPSRRRTSIEGGGGALFRPRWLIGPTLIAEQFNGKKHSSVSTFYQPAEIQISELSPFLVNQILGPIKIKAHVADRLAEQVLKLLAVELT